MTEPVTRHLVLVGLMGSGKTTVARQLGQRLGRPVLDSDEMIEQRTGKTVRQIFAHEGEDAFRALETEVLGEALAHSEPSVIAAAGGVVLRAENREMLRSDAADVVWLRADPALLLERVEHGHHRPLLDDDALGMLWRMHHEREPLYREVADRVVDVDGLSVADVVELVLG